MLHAKTTRLAAMDLRAWSREALRRFEAELEDDAYWHAVFSDRARRAVHLAVVGEPFLSHVLDGTKRLESRFSVRRYPPFQRIARGDIVLVKAAAGPIEGLCEAGTTRFDELVPGKLEEIRAELAEALCATEDAFWETCRDARYVSLIELLAFRPVLPLACPKRDRRGWVVLEEPSGKGATSEAPPRRRSSRPPPTW